MNYKKTYISPLGIIYMRSDGEYLTGLWFEKSRDDLKHQEISRKRIYQYLMKQVSG